MSEFYEVIIYTASIAKYALPLIERLDPFSYAAHHLFRTHCTLINNCFVKDLSLLGRDLSRVIIVDNSPNSFALQPDNGILIQTWLGDPADTRLYQLMPILESLANVEGDVRPFLRRTVRGYEKNYEQTLLQLTAEINRRKLEPKVPVPIQIAAGSPTKKCIIKKPVPSPAGSSRGQERTVARDPKLAWESDLLISAKPLPVHIRISN